MFIVYCGLDSRTLYRIQVDLEPEFNGLSFFLSQDFQSLHEAYYSLKNGKLEGIMEEMFTAVEFIKMKSNSELSIAQFFEDEHGFGAAIKEDDFDGNVLECLSGLTEFVSDDIYSNASAFLKSLPVSIYLLQSLLHLPGQQNTRTICSACTSISGIILL